MRVLQINATYGAGSTGTIVADIHKLLLDSGVDSYVAYSTANLSDSKIINGYRIGNTAGKKLHALLCRAAGRQAYFSSFATRRLISFVQKIKPDVVHLHNLHSNYINLNMFLRFLAREDIRTVITLHDCWFYTGGCFHYTAAGCDRWQSKCEKCPQRNVGTRSFLWDSSGKILKDREKYFGAIKKLTVVGVSDWISDEAKKSVLRPDNVKTIYNGVDMSFYKPVKTDIRERLGLSDRFIIMGMANKWLKPVNRQLLDEVCKNLKDDMAFVMVGCTDAQKHKICDKIVNLPFVNSREEMRELYSAADVFANCTREESFSLVNAEAQACGTPVIVYANTGAKETVSDEHGFKIENGNIKDFINAIETVYQKGKTSYSEGCMDFVRSRFDKTENYLKYLELYKGGEL